MKANHTSGPWRCAHIETDAAVNNLIHTFEVYTSPEVEHNNEIGEANARLIEAAPKLLDRLEICQAILKKLMEQTNDEQEWGGKESRICAFIDTIKANNEVISKAKGNG